MTPMGKDISDEAIDYGIIKTRIGKMNWPERDNLQKEIRETWSRVSVTQSVRLARLAVSRSMFTTYSHYFAPLGFLVERYYK